MIENGYEKKDRPFFSMDIQESRYQIYFTQQEERYEPYGVISTYREESKLHIEEEMPIEEWVIRLLKHFGNTEDIKEGDISYSVDEENNLNFFGPFGCLSVDEDSNLLFETDCVST